MELRFRCIKCGICCTRPFSKSDNEEDKVTKKIPVYPEEADILIMLAAERNLPLRLMEDGVMADKMNQKILITKYYIMLDEGETCPFSKDSSCTIYDQRPLVCRAYPVALLETDAFKKEIYIDKKCNGIIEIENELHLETIEDIKSVFPIEYRMAVKLFNREKQIIFRLKELINDGKIELDHEITIKDFEIALKDWDRTIIYTELD